MMSSKMETGIENPDLKSSRITMAIHTALGILMGWVSTEVGAMYGDWIAGFLGIIILIVIGYASAGLVGKKGVKFWLANGVIVYLLVWLVSWVYFFNTVF